jgi:hypothetical protein
MGVLACDRFDCSNVMCHYMVLHSTMYICGDCREELRAWFYALDHGRLSVDGENSVVDAIREFMCSSTQVRTNLSYPEITIEFERLLR